MKLLLSIINMIMTVIVIFRKRNIETLPLINLMSACTVSNTEFVSVVYPSHFK